MASPAGWIRAPQLIKPGPQADIFRPPSPTGAPITPAPGAKLPPMGQQPYCCTAASPFRTSPLPPTSRWCRPAVALCWCSTARSTTSANCAPSWRPRGTASAPAATPRCCWSCWPARARRPCPGCAACTPSVCGIARAAAPCWPAIPTASSPSTSGRGRQGSCCSPRS